MLHRCIGTFSYDTIPMRHMSENGSSTPGTPESHIAHYLATGEYDINRYVDWPGESMRKSAFDDRP